MSLFKSRRTQASFGIMWIVILALFALFLISPVAVAWLASNFGSMLKTLVVSLVEGLL